MTDSVSEPSFILPVPKPDSVMASGEPSKEFEIKYDDALTRVNVGPGVLAFGEKLVLETEQQFYDVFWEHEDEYDMPWVLVWEVFDPFSETFRDKKFVVEEVTTFRGKGFVSENAAWEWTKPSYRLNLSWHIVVKNIKGNSPSMPYGCKI